MTDNYENITPQEYAHGLEESRKRARKNGDRELEANLKAEIRHIAPKKIYSFKK